MKRITKKIFTLLLIFTMIFSLGKWEIFASEISDAQNKKNSLEKKKEETENMLASLEKKKNNILEYIEELDKQLSSIEQSIDELNDKIAVTEINLSKTKEELKQAQEEEKNQYEAMNPIANMLKDFLTQRKKYKAEMFKIEDTTSPRYKDFDRYQLNEKVNANS